MWNHLYIEMQPDFGPDWIIVLLRNVESSLYRNDFTFLKKTIIQSGPKIWLHLYIEMIPHFLRMQCFFYIKVRFFRECNLCGINSISVIDALCDSAPFSVVRATTGEFATITSVIETLYIYFSTKMADLSTKFTWVKDLRTLCSENLFITENTEWVSFIIIA